MSNNNNKLCLAWLTYNRDDLNRDMARQCACYGYDCYVIDNGSEKPINTDVGVNKLINPVNGYFTGGWNFAMKALSLKYDYVWMMNDDIQGVNKRSVDDMLNVMETNPNAFAITPSFNSPHQVFHISYHEPKLVQLKWIDWCCPVVRTSMWTELGGFDESFKGYGADLILSKKARDKKFLLLKNNDVIIHHLGSQTATSESKVDIMCSNGEMDKVLREKYGYNGWWELV